MSQSLARNAIHLIFSTKHRQPFIEPPVRDNLFAYLAGTLNALHCPALQVGGVADHVHILFVLAKTLSLSRAVEEVKKESSKWAKTIIHPKFYWQKGYGAFSVSASNERPWRTTSSIRSVITGGCPTRRSFASSSRSMAWSMTSGMCGIEAGCPTPSGWKEKTFANLGRCPRLSCASPTD